jgi:hypothetical protein
MNQCTRIGTRRGLEKFDCAANTFIHYSPNPSDTGNAESNHAMAIREAIVFN